MARGHGVVVGLLVLGRSVELLGDVLPGDLPMVRPSRHYEAQIATMRMTERAQEVLRTSSPYWVIASAALPDSAFGFEGEMVIPVAPITGASVMGHDLEKWEELNARGPFGEALTVWSGSWLSSSVVDAYCGLMPAVRSGSADVDLGVITICDEQCYETPAEPVGSLDVDVDVLGDELRIRWSTIQGATEYGVLAWDAAPRPQAFVDGLAYSSGPAFGNSAVIPRHLEEDDIHVGVWARNMQTTGECRERYGEYVSVNIHARYVIDLVPVDSDQATSLPVNSWGEVKWMPNMPRRH